jgi:hypothetical protein
MYTQRYDIKPDYNRPNRWTVIDTMNNNMPILEDIATRTQALAIAIKLDKKAGNR